MHWRVSLLDMINIFLAFSLFFLGCQCCTAAILNVIGDTGNCDFAGTAQVSTAIKHAKNGRNKTWLLEVGDLAYPVATRSRLLECHEQHFSTIGRRLAVPGNHDWYDSGAAGFFSVFPSPVPRKEKLEGPWVLLMLDSNLTGKKWERQATWLRTELKKSRGECIIAAWHHPRWSSGMHGDQDFVAPLWDLLVGRATITLHGHDHHFEAIAPLTESGSEDAQRGLASFIVGTGGAELYKPGEKKRSDMTVFGKWGFLRLVLEGTNYGWKFITVDNEVVASGTGACRITGT